MLDGSMFKAKVINYNEYYNIALLKIESPDRMKLLFLRWGDSDKQNVGELTVAIDNPF